MKGRTFGHVEHCQHVVKGLWVLILILTTGFGCPHLQWRNLYPARCVCHLSSWTLQAVTVLCCLSN
jgi:hypothetical protein